jgi:conjugative transfer signal peptidase TraF
MPKSRATRKPNAVRASCSLGLFVAAFSSACWWLGIRLNLTASMPVGLYRIVQTRTQRNVLVLICLPESIAEFAHERGYVPNGYCHSGVAPLGKSIVAVPGDTVAMTPAGLQVNGSLIPNSRPLPRDGRNRGLPELTTQLSVVPPHQFWVLSQYSNRSFDSRYFGPIPDTSVRATIRPLLTQD